MPATLNDFSNLLRDAARQSPGCDCNQLQAYRWQPEGNGRELSMDAFGATTCNGVEFWSRACEDRNELRGGFPALFMFVIDYSTHNAFRFRSVDKYRIQLSVLGQLTETKGACGDCDNLTPNSLTARMKSVLRYVLAYIGEAVYTTITLPDGKTGTGLYNLPNLELLKAGGIITDYSSPVFWNSTLPIDIQGEDIVFATEKMYGTHVTITLQFVDCDPNLPTLMLPDISFCPVVETDCCN